MLSSNPVYNYNLTNEGAKNASELPSCSMLENPLSKISFSRDDLLKIKESKNSSLELDEKLILTNSKVLFKILKPECKILERQSKPHDQNGIILGPQKRSWNTGCHVSQTKRSPQDSNFSKGQKSFQENKFTRNDFKRDYKLPDRNFGRASATNNLKFSRGIAHGKNDSATKRHISESLKDTEKEPEWFTDGPETINDTVELGMVIEDNDSKVDKPSNDKPDQSMLDPSDIDSAILSLDKDKLPPHSPVASTILAEADVLNFLDLPKIGNESTRLRQFANPRSDISSPISKNSLSGDKSSSRLLKLLARPIDSFSSQSQAVIPPSQPSTAELESALKALFIGDASTPTLKSLEIPNVSSEPSLLTAFPTVEEIEAAAFHGDGKGASKPKSTLPFVLLDQLANPWSLKQQLGPPSSNFGDSFAFAGISRPEGKMSNWSEPFAGDAFIDPSGDPPSFSRVHGQSLNRHISSSSKLLPNDPAIAFQSTNYRPFIKSSSVVPPLMSQNQQRALSSQQSPYFPLNVRPCMPSALRSNQSMGTALLQLKSCDLVQQNPSTPPNSLFSSNATISSSSNNRLEHLFSASTAAASTMSPNGFYIRPQLRQNGSAPNLLPPAWQAAAATPLSAVDFLRSNITGRSGIGGPLPSSDLELSALHRNAS